MSAITALAVLGQILVLLGHAGWLRAPLLAVLYAATIAFCLRRAPWKRVALATLASAPLLVLASYPPVAFDETLYHLPFIEAFAKLHRIAFLPYLRHPLFPQLHELLCLGPFVAFGDVAPHFVSVVELLLLAALLVSWPERREAGLLAVALCLGHPIVVQLATATYVEVALTLFVAAGFRAAQRDQPLLAGFLFATAASVKYHGWYFAAFGAAYLLLFGARRARTLAHFAAGFVAGAAPTYVRLVAETGNPLFPFVSRIFGVSPWLPEAYHNPHPVKAALRLLWDITFARDRTGLQPPYSPLFALSIVIVVIAAFRDRRAVFLTILCAGYVAAFTFMPPDSRYLLPLLPLVSVVAAEAIAPLLERRWLIALSLLAIAPALAYAGYRIGRQGFPPMTAASRQRYLEEHVPEYAAAQRRDRGRTYVCGAEQLQYYGHGELVGEVLGPYDQEVIVGKARTSARLAERLRRIGANNLLMSRRACPEAWRRLPAAPDFELVYTDTGAVLWRVAPGAPVNSR